MSDSRDPIRAARAALREVDGIAQGLEMFSTDATGGEHLMPLGARRRRLRAGRTDPVATLSLLVNDQGVLVWDEGNPLGGGAGLRRRAGGNRKGSDGELVELYQFEKLEPNEINKFLTDIDHKLNDRPGLRQVTRQGGATSTAIVDYNTAHVPKGKKRRLLIVHGTFSKCDAIFDGVAQAKTGGAFWKRAFAHYDEVLAFEHATLSVSPVLNAFDLARALRGASGPLDIIAHSRGGLVTRWYLEGLGAPTVGPTRAVLVGSPLAGTSLAAPPRLKDSLAALSNYGTMLQAGGAAASAFMPLLAAPLALMRIATSVISVAARTPVIDAAVAMIPGLAAQSRVGLNHELSRVHGFGAAAPPWYAVVQSDFETADPRWRFWQWFRKDKIKDALADAVFPGQNDLVVDTASMNHFVAQSIGVPAKRILDFGTGDTVHHTNYFAQPDTLDFILDQFQVP